MSTVQDDELSTIARAALGRPVRVELVRVLGAIAEVRADPSACVTRFPADALFVATELQCEALIEAYRRRDRQRLDALWAELGAA
jgi:hypothetical protein